MLLFSMLNAVGAWRILPLGDSITDGFSVPGGYRVELNRLLVQAGCPARFIGTQTDTGLPASEREKHEGHSGYRIDQINSGITQWLESVDDPDVILLLIGTNDYGQEHETDQAVNRLDQLLERIATLRPSARIIVANLLRRTDNPTANNAIQREFNPAIPGLVNKHVAKGQRVYFLDMCAALGPDDLIDGLHPNPTGYHKMAASWFGAIQKIVAVESAGVSVINFDGASLDGSANHVPLSPVYQPVCGLRIGYENVGIFNLGPDHTTGISGGPHYNTFNYDGARPQVFTFSRAVAVPSVCVSTFNGAASETSLVKITAFADAAGLEVMTNITCAVPPHPYGGHYAWLTVRDLDNLGARIRRLEFNSEGNAQVDDLAVGISTNLGVPKSIALQLPVREAHEVGQIQLKALARYESDENADVTSGAGVIYTSSNTNVLVISKAGLLTGVREGHADITAALMGLQAKLSIQVLPGALMDFNAGLNADLNRQLLSADYQPIPGLHVTYENVGLFNGGPDHTTGTLAANQFNAYQFHDHMPQVYSFSKPISVPKLWLTTYSGGGAPVQIAVFADEAGRWPLGTVAAETTKFSGAGAYIWSQCIKLNDPIFNGKIRRLEIFTVGGGNANVDDISMLVSTNSGALEDVQLRLPDERFFVGTKAQASLVARYENFGDTLVTSGCGAAYRTSDNSVVAVDASGLLTAVGSGRAIITVVFGTMQSSLAVEVSPAHLVDFSLPDGDIGNFVPMPDNYEPIPGLIIDCNNVGIFNGGPDHTRSKTGGNNYNTYQLLGSKPQVFRFSYPVGIPSFALTTYEGSGRPVTVSAYADGEGRDLIGSTFILPPKHGGPGTYAWTLCTNLDSAKFREKIRRLEFFGADNANLDDLVVDTSANLGNLRSLTFSVPTQEMIPNTSRQVSVFADFDFGRNCDLTRMPETIFKSSDTNVVSLDQAGVLHAVNPGNARISVAFRGNERSLPISVRQMSGTLIHFNDLAPFGNRIAVPASYQPVPGLTLKYENVGLYNGGPDHTTGILGGNNFNTYQYQDGHPQVFRFSQPVSLPSFWLSTYWGDGDQISISAFSDEEGKNLLGTSFMSSAAFPGPGNYRWVECKNLDVPAFNGRIRRLEIFGNDGNAQLDDLLVR